MMWQKLHFRGLLTGKMMQPAGISIFRTKTLGANQSKSIQVFTQTHIHEASGYLYELCRPYVMQTCDLAAKIESINYRTKDSIVSTK